MTGKVGHYTQIVWAESYKIGCGYIMYKKGKRFNKVRYNMIIIPILVKIQFNAQTNKFIFFEDFIFGFNKGFGVQLWFFDKNTCQNLIVN